MWKLFGFMFAFFIFFSLLNPAANAADTGLLKGADVRFFNIDNSATSISGTPSNATKSNILTDGLLFPTQQIGGWFSKFAIDLGENKTYKISSYQLSVGQSKANSLEFYNQTGQLISKVDITKNDFVKTDITAVSGVRYVVLKTGNWIGELEIYGTEEGVLPQPVTNLSAQGGNSNVMLNWDSVTEATYYNVKRSLVANGPYTQIGTSSTNDFIDSSVTNGITYYYVVTSVSGSGESNNSNEVSATPVSPQEQLQVIIAPETIKVGETFTSEIALKNVNGIYAEDFSIDFDSNLFEFLGFEEVSGYKVYNQPTVQSGKIRFIVASQGQSYGITGEKTFLKLNFRAKTVGSGKIDALNCRIADLTREFDLLTENCMDDTIVVERAGDVNRSGEYTLLDLAIDGYYYGQLASNANPAQYDTNQAGDEYVNDADLLYIVSQMLQNNNYTPNSI